MVAPSLFVVMGVSGSGKSTIGALLASRLGVPYAEADDFHSATNIAKMAAGHPLTDDDRGPWLDAVGAWIDSRLAARGPGVITCSALKRAYRDRLRRGRPSIELVYLHGTKQLIGERLVGRQGHFLKASMLASQFTDLEEPTPDEQIVTVNIVGAPSDIVDEILSRLGARA